MYNQSQYQKKSISNALMDKKRMENYLNPTSPRMIPRGQPVVDTKSDYSIIIPNLSTKAVHDWYSFMRDGVEQVMNTGVRCWFTILMIVDTCHLWSDHSSVLIFIAFLRKSRISVEKKKTKPCVFSALCLLIYSRYAGILADNCAVKANVDDYFCDGNVCLLQVSHQRVWSYTWK